MSGGCLTTRTPASTKTRNTSPYTVMLVCGLPFLMVTLDGTIVNVALPSIAKDLGATL
ncbi:hypothetical protein [Microbacterium sp.]|uniref:hypothetical protein n=1 Tax=Microbacterium sp. TaxID=51671 RepID=UPI003F9E07B0